MKEEEMWTITQLAQRRGTSVISARDTVRAWSDRGLIFSVTYEGAVYLPAFQFNEAGEPLPLVRRVLKILRRDASMTDWEKAIWFSAPTGWLSGESPKTLLAASDSASLNRLINAAEQEVAPD